MANLGETQYAVQLIGPDELILNTSKEIFQPGRHQILCRIEAVGLCFSDLKLLKQFSSHTRKSEIVSGIDPSVLTEIPSYVPGEAPAVPGHETVVKIETVGSGVEDFKPGQRYLVETDYRWLRTAGSNAAFGYNFEGALQEYVLMDERVITSPNGDSMLIPVPERLCASAIALVEPWACVEDAYACKQRRKIKADGRMAVVADVEVSEDLFCGFLNRFGRPGKISWVSGLAPPDNLNVQVVRVNSVAVLTDGDFDDVIYFGSKPQVVEALFAKLAASGLLNIVLCGSSLGRKIDCAVGRVHYGGIRIIATGGSDPAAAMENIPASGEIRQGDKINVIGAAGPMGIMHVIRNICGGVENITVFAGDVDDTRLAKLNSLAEVLAHKNNIGYKSYNPSRSNGGEEFDYTVLMAPSAPLVADAVGQAAGGGIINIFAGIGAHITQAIDLDSYISKRLYFIGTSGSTLEDMKIVLEKLQDGSLNTNLSVAAVCGLDGAIEGMRAVENHVIAGKIIAYPQCKELGLVPLQQMQGKMPQVARALGNGLWNLRAEQTLLQLYKGD